MNGFVGNSGESKTRGTNILQRDAEIVRKE